MVFQSECEGSDVSGYTFSQKPELLLVDDSTELLSVLGELLAANGFNVVAATSVDEAIQLLGKFTPDLIICDLMLPVRLGYDLQTHTRNNEVLSEVPFVFLTGVSDDSKKRLALETGCDAYVQKPFDPSDLLSLVVGKVKLSQARRENSKRTLDGDRKRIIQTLSHELRTPLVSISAGSELLLREQANLSDVQFRSLLESIWRGGRRLETLVNDFLLLQQIHSGHSEHVQRTFKKKFEVGSMLHCLHASFIEELEAQSTEIVVKGGEKLHIDGYDIQIADAVRRLLFNARKFGGSAPVEISWRRTEDKKELVIDIRDFGPGIQEPERVLAKALEAFSQIDREKKEQQGCGLGLAIATHYSRINRGNLSLRRPGEGAGLIARLRFPLA